MEAIVFVLVLATAVALAERADRALAHVAQPCSICAFGIVFTGGQWVHSDGEILKPFPGCPRRPFGLERDILHPAMPGRPYDFDLAL